MRVPEPPNDHTGGSYATAAPEANRPGAQPQPAPASYQPGAQLRQPQAAPAGYQPGAQQQAAQADYQLGAQPGAQPRQPHADPVGYPPGTQPLPQQSAPTNYQPGVQPPPAPSAYEGKPDPKGPTSGVANMLKAIPLKKVLTIAIPTIVVIAALIIGLSMIGGSGGSTVRSSITWFDRDGDTVVSINNNARIILDGSVDTALTSIDGSKTVMLVKDRGESEGTLWFLSASGSARIAEYVLAFRLSDSGNGVAYITDYNSRKDVATLYLYDTSAKKGVKITEDAAYPGYGDLSGVCISPNGKSLGYTGDFNVNSYKYSGYISIDGKAPEKLGEYMVALAISDGGRYLYYLKNNADGDDRSFHVRSGNSDNRLISGFDGSSGLLFNRDYSQVLFEHQGKSYLSRNGGEREKIGGSTITGFLTPRGTQRRYVPGEVYLSVIGIDNLINQVAYTSEGLVYINGGLEANRISSSDDYKYSAVISSNGKTLLYLNNSGHLSAIDPTDPNAERREVARNVERFVATSDAKTIYYVNDEQTLLCIKGNGFPAKISEDVSYRYLVMPFNSKNAFFLTDYSEKHGGELYYSVNGGIRIKVPGGSDVVDLWSTPANLFFQNYDGEVFRSGGDEKFSLFADDID